MHLVTQVLEPMGTFNSLHHVCTFPDMQGIDPDSCADPLLLNLDNYQQRRPAAFTVHGSHLGPAILMEPEHNGRVVVIIRDPLDALYSMHQLLLSTIRSAAPSFAELYRNQFAEWADFALQWWRQQQRHPTQVLLLWFELVVADLAGTSCT